SRGRLGLRRRLRRGRRVGRGPLPRVELERLAVDGGVDDDGRGALRGHEVVAATLEGYALGVVVAEGDPVGLLRVLALDGGVDDAGVLHPGVDADAVVAAVARLGVDDGDVVGAHV